MVLDCRSPEAGAGHIPGAWPVAVYCSSGYRSSLAGFDAVVDFSGGFAAGKARALPVEGSD